MRSMLNRNSPSSTTESVGSVAEEESDLQSSESAPYLQDVRL